MQTRRHSTGHYQSDPRHPSITHDEIGEVKIISIYETTPEKSHSNIFIKQVANFQTKLANYHVEKKKGIYDTTLLESAEDALIGANAIALQQVEVHNSVDYKCWLRTQRWAVGSWFLLKREWEALNNDLNAERIEKNYNAFVAVVDDLDTVKIGSFPDFHIKFNDMTRAGNVFLSSSSSAYTSRKNVRSPYGKCT